LVTALPWFGAMLGMYYNSAHSDRSGERYWHIGAPAALAAMALLMAWAAGAGALGLAALFVAGLGLGAAQGAFWALPTTLLTGNSLAVGAVAINIVGTAGGLVMPHLIGFALERSGDFAGPTLLIAAVLLLGAALVATVRLALGRTPVARAG
jgi:ACS family tartrate transporter-like MFS transporter